MSSSRVQSTARGRARRAVVRGDARGNAARRGLACCASPAPDLDRDTAGQLQAQVLAVSKAAAANDPAGCLKLLDELQTRLDAAATNGEVSFKRHQGIKSSIDAVRADLAAQQAAAEAARVAAEQAAAAEASAQAAAAQRGSSRGAGSRARPGSTRRRRPRAGTGPGRQSQGQGKGEGQGQGKRLRRCSLPCR